MNLSEKLKKSRDEKGLKQKELAEKLDVSLSVIGDIEYGRRPPSKKMAQKLAQFFNTPIHYWQDEEESNNYITNKDEFEYLKKAICGLKEAGHIKDGIPSEEDWEVLKQGLSLDLRFMKIKSEGDEQE